MGKRRRMVSGIRYTYGEITGARHLDKDEQNTDRLDESTYDFDMDCLTYLPLKNPLICPYGYSFSKDSVQKYLVDHTTHPFVEGAPFSLDCLVAPKFSVNANGQKIDPINDQILTSKNKLVMIRTTGNVFNYQTVKEFNINGNMMIDLITAEPFERKDIITIHDPDNDQDLPPDPLISTKVEVEDSTIVKNAAKFIESLNMTKEQALKTDNYWYLARPTQESLKLACMFKGNPPKKLPHAIISTTLGDIVVELDVDISTLACINFIGYSFRNAYNNVRVEKVISTEYFIVCPKISVDESVWTFPFAFERDDRRRNYKYCLFLLPTGNRQLKISNTGKFAVSAKSLDLDENHVFGGVIGGEGIVSSICNGKIMPDGRPAKPFSIKSISIVNNPFPMTDK